MTRKEIVHLFVSSNLHCLDLLLAPRVHLYRTDETDVNLRDDLGLDEAYT